MYRLDILQNQWMMFSLISGIVLILGMILFLLMLWKPRDEETGETAGESESPRQAFPWFLVVLYIGLLMFAVAYVVHRAIVSPNW